jgi:hypothetical protein
MGPRQMRLMNRGLELHCRIGQLKGDVKNVLLEVEQYRHWDGKLFRFGHGLEVVVRRSCSVSCCKPLVALI